jgi:leucyl-tRNA synthetase
MHYLPNEIEPKWQKRWAENKTYKAYKPDETSPVNGKTGSELPKYYVLDMFPYPSGAGLHVGHPLGYIASDIIARYKRHRGFNVLHPMGYDSFGLPAEQYAIQTGQHPAKTTQENIARYREQLDKIGFSFDWDREVRTSNPDYYKWTQWIFLKLFNSWYNKESDKAEPIETLIEQLKQNPSGFQLQKNWNDLNEKEQSDVLMDYRLAYLSEAYVNWCPALGTVLANDEVKDGVSERGGHPVERKLMKQWSLRITAYAERLLKGLDEIEWSESIKEAQRNWIGKSEGSSLVYKLSAGGEVIEVFTTRPDTIFGVSYLTLAPEHELVEKITTPEQKEKVEAYLQYAKNRSERERMAEVKKVTGEFTGAYAIHPFTGQPIPIWVGDYVLAGYGTGAVMAVPGHDTRDYAFAKQFGLPIVEVVEGGDLSKEAYDAKAGKMINSDFLNGLEVKQAIKAAIAEIEKRGIGKGKVNYRLRDAVFGRQRYWGEPIPIYYENDVPKGLSESELPLELPEVDKYLPTEDGEPPLARAKDWKYKGEFEYEYTTMPGWAGSSWYYLRYMDAHNERDFVSKTASDYWQQIDLYMGGAEHATGHLLYFRFWTKFLKDLGCISIDEPAKKLINQGMIQGTSAIVFRVNGTNKIISAGLRDKYETTPIHIEVNIVENSVVNLELLKQWRDDLSQADFELENGKLMCHHEVEKMSKRWFNVVTPDKIGEQYGADTLRLYEMFLGPLEDHKPWNTNGITGVFNFLKKLWRLYVPLFENPAENDGPASKAELKALHKTIRKVTEDLDRYSFNTIVSAFMICVNELTDLKCHKREILEPLCVLIAPYAPHIAEELWEKLGHKESVVYAQWPVFNEQHLQEDSFAYPVSFNGKTRFNLELSLSLNPQEVEKEVLAYEETLKYLEGKTPKKVIVVPKKIVNVVV